MEKFFVNRPIFAIVIAIVIVLLGGLSISSLPIERYPDITPPVVEVEASYMGADATSVNDAVATPIGESIMGVGDMLKNAMGGIKGLLDTKMVNAADYVL